MAQNPPEGTQRVIPYITYADAPAALEFLGKAFDIAFSFWWVIFVKREFYSSINSLTW